MIGLGLIAALVVGCVAGWLYRITFEHTRADLRLIDSQTKLLKLHGQLTGLRAEILQLEGRISVYEGIHGPHRRIVKKRGTKDHLCHDERCDGHGHDNHYCHNGDCGRQETPYVAGKPHGHPCETCKAPAGVPCWEERHAALKKKRS